MSERRTCVSAPNYFTMGHYIMLMAFLGTRDTVWPSSSALPTTAWREPDGGPKASLL